MNGSVLPSELIGELMSIHELQILDLPAERERFSRDFFDYSPVLNNQLKDCCAELVVRPSSVEGVVAVSVLLHPQSVSGKLQDPSS